MFHRTLGNASHLTALGNRHIQVRHVPSSSSSLSPLYLLDDVYAIYHLAEDNVLAVKMGRRYRSNEELRSIGIWSGILVQLL